MKKSSPSQPASKIPGMQYLAEVWRELKKVDWPSQNQTIQQTVLVMAVSILIAAYLGGLDYFFDQLLGFIIR